MLAHIPIKGSKKKLIQDKQSVNANDIAYK